MTDRLPDLRPGEELDYEIDATHLLARDDGGAIIETLDAGQCTITVTGATKASQVVNTTNVQFWLNGATQGQTIKVDARLRTSGGRKFARLYVIPYGEPVSLDQAKAQCRIELDDTDEDALIAGYITAAREFVENDTGHVLVRRSFTEYRDCFSRFIELYRRPAVSVESVGYIDTAGQAQTYASPVLSIDRNPPRIFPALNGWWPSVQRNTSVSIAYTAGYAEGDVPQAFVQAMLLLIGHWWANREAVNISTATPAEVPFAVKHLLEQSRIPSI